MIESTPSRRSIITAFGSVGSMLLVAGCMSSDEDIQESSGGSDGDTEDKEESEGPLFTRVEFVDFDLVATLNEDLLEDVEDIVLVQPNGEEEDADMEGDRVEHSFNGAAAGTSVYYSSGEYILRAVTEFDEKIEEYSLDAELDLTVSEVGTLGDLGLSEDEAESRNRVGVILENTGGIPVSISGARIDTSDTPFSRISDSTLPGAAALGEEMTLKLPPFSYDTGNSYSPYEEVEEYRGEYDTEIIIDTEADENIRIPIRIKLQGEIDGTGSVAGTTYYFSDTEVVLRE